MTLSEAGLERPLGSQLVEILSLGSEWDRQGEPPEQIVAAVDQEIAQVIEQSSEHAQRFKDQQLIDVLEYLVEQRGQGQAPDDRVYFDMAVEKLLGYIDDHNVGGPHKNPWQALSRMMKIRRLLIDEGAPIDRIDQTIAIVKGRLVPLRHPTSDVTPADSISQVGSNLSSFGGQRHPTTGVLERQQTYVSPDLASSFGLRGATNSDVWMQTDDYFLIPTRVAFLGETSKFTLDSDQLLFKYLPDYHFFLFIRREEGYLPAIIRGWSCSPEQILRVTVDLTKSYVMLDVQDFDYRILIHTVASLLDPWLRRLQRLNPSVTIEVTTYVKSNQVLLPGLILTIAREDMMQYFDNIPWRN